MLGTVTLCIEPNCGRQTKAKSRCEKHYKKWLAVRPDGKKCNENGCTGVAITRGLCQKHYSHLIYVAKTTKICSVADCGRSVWAKGLCHNHHRLTSCSVKRNIDMIDVETIKDVLTSGEVAKICSCSARTVAKWIDSGLLPGYTIPGKDQGHRRVLKNELIKFCEFNKLPMLITSKKTVLIYGQRDAEVIKAVGQSELGIRVEIVNDPFTAGFIYAEFKPILCIVNCDFVRPNLSMIKKMCAGTSEVIVVTGDKEASSLLDDTDADIMVPPPPSLSLVRSMIDTISQRL